MFVFKDLLRENIKNLAPYKSARSEFSEQADIYIDANENPFNNSYNRYPDPLQMELKKVIAGIKGVAAENIFLGNGSDEIIDILMRSICRPGVDNMITYSPSYSMYEVSANINDVEIRKINLSPNLLPDLEETFKLVDSNTKLLFLCTPNNPIGNVIPMQQIEAYCQRFKGIVLVDEAYIDFTDAPSAVQLLAKYPNLLVLQTLSKAYGLAGLRLGMAFASTDIVTVLNKVKPPYNISCLSQSTALHILKDTKKVQQQVATLKAERERLFAALQQLGLFEKIYPSQANFILVTTPDYGQVYQYLLKHKVVVRQRHIPPLISGGLRISIGTPDENSRVIELLKEYKK